MSRIQKFLIWLSPRKIYIPTQLKLQKKWLGSTYGGFFVHPQILNPKSIALSFGVGEDISFDLSLIDLTGAQVLAFDPTPKVQQFILPHIKKNPKLSFTPVGLGAEDGETWFYPPENPDHISCSVVPNEVTKSKAYKVKMKKLATIVTEKNIKDFDLLKIDIEGAEYDVVPAFLDEGLFFKQILMEIHPDFFPDGRKKTRVLLKKMNDFGYKIFGVSDTCRELSFIRTDEKLNTA